MRERGRGKGCTVEVQQLVVAGLAEELLGVLDGLLEFCAEGHGGRGVPGARTWGGGRWTGRCRGEERRGRQQSRRRSLVVAARAICRWSRAGRGNGGGSKGGRERGGGVTSTAARPGRRDRGSRYNIWAPEVYEQTAILRSTDTEHGIRKNKNKNKNLPYVPEIDRGRDLDITSNKGRKVTP